MNRVQGGLQPLQYVALERLRVPRPVDRLEFMSARARGKSVFDLGALDETAIDAKQHSGNWLHARLSANAVRVIGIDNSALLPPGGLETGNTSCIIRADIFQLDPVIDSYGRPDLIVIGELIEHLPDTMGFLRSLKQNPALRGVELVFSTPNACCWHNGFIGLAGMESMHVDHLQIYSYKTLRTLFGNVGIELEQLVPCHARFYEMIEGASGPKRLAVGAFQKLVNTLEYLTPMLSAGWVGVARL